MVTRNHVLDIHFVVYANTKMTIPDLCYAIIMLIHASDIQSVRARDGG